MERSFGERELWDSILDNNLRMPMSFPLSLCHRNWRSAMRHA